MHCHTAEQNTVKKHIMHGMGVTVAVTGMGAAPGPRDYEGTHTVGART